jgi:hypothetical protein
MGKLMLNLPLSRGISISVELIKTNPIRSNSVKTELKETAGKPGKIQPSTNLFNQIHFNQDINNFYKKG